MKVKFKKIIVISLCCIMLTSCWDKVEIDKKVFISTIGIDIGEDISKEKEVKDIDSNDPFPERQIKKINVTYGYPDMSKLGPGKGGTAEEKIITTEAYSMEDSFSKATSKSSRNVHLGHMELLVLSNEILLYPETMKEIIDYLQRQPLINRMMMVVVVEGKAEDYLKFKPEMEQNIETYIKGLMENSDRNASILPVSLNEMLILLSENGNTIIPKITLDKEKNEIKLTGVAVIKDYKLEGNINEVETSDIEIIRGKLKGGKKVIYKDGHPIDYVIDGIQRKIRVDTLSQDKLRFNIDIKLEGQLKGYTVDEKVFSKEKLNEIEKNIDNSLSVECEKVVKIIKDQYKVEVFGLQEYIEKFKPRLWKKVEKNWEEVFSSSEVNITIHSKVRRIGVAE